MINLNRLQYVLFDFDDTLCIHSEHRDSEEDEKKYHNAVFAEKGKPFRTGKPNYQMKRFMEELRVRNIGMGLISATKTCRHAIRKNEWVKEVYGISMEQFSVYARQDKVFAMETLACARHIPHDCILIVDDIYDTLHEAEEKGFQACTPMEIVNCINEKEGKNG